MNFFQLIDNTDNTYINFNLLIYINLWIDFNQLPYPGMTRQHCRALLQLYILLVRNWALTKYIYIYIYLVDKVPQDITSTVPNICAHMHKLDKKDN